MNIDRVVDNEYLSLVLETKDDGRVFAHSNIHKWSKELYEHYLLLWVDVTTELRNKGVKVLFANAPVSDIKVLKFQMMFGFMPVEIQVDPENGIEYYLSEVKL